MRDTTRNPKPGGQAPTLLRDRHTLVDALRGAALLGIVIVNVEFIFQPAAVGWGEYTSTTDVIARWLVAAFAQLKIYPIFALLFGYGLSVQINRARKTGTEIGRRYSRRMGALLLLGIAHAVLFFPGDILVIYAFVGALAFLLRKRSSPFLLRLAIAVYGIAATVWVLLGFLAFFEGADFREQPSAASIQILTDGSFGTVIGNHLMDWTTALVLLVLVQGPAAFAFVLAGIILGRTDILSSPLSHRAQARRTLLIAGPIGVITSAVGATLYISGAEMTGLGFAIGFLAAPAISVAYVAFLLLVWPVLPGALLRLLQAAGRMSLSVYLLQSVVLSSLSYGYGMGLFGQLAPLPGTLLAVSVWMTLSLFSLAWLRVARFGPAEWVLRSVSYGHPQPLLRRRELS
jgi:uncharacterized protein